MPLQRIRTSAAGGALDAARIRLRAEGVRIRAGRTMLNRHVAAPSALIVLEGALRVGVTDDDALLRSGEGVLLPAGTVYSLQADVDTTAFVFTLPERAEGGTAPER